MEYIFNFQVPYTPTLFILGIALGYFCDSFNSIFMEYSIKRMSEVNPHGLLQIFLPILVFEAAYNLDWHIFKKELPQICILAFPCVMINAVMMMFCIKTFFYPTDVFI